MTYSLITTNADLAAYCQQARQYDAVTLDTEFVRTRTLYPNLGLVQLYDGQSLVLVDPVAIDDLAPLCALLTDESVVKVMHSCSEDMEAFWTTLGVLPKPVFDTQFSAGLLNMGSALGYAKLIEMELGVVLDKGESRTDWMARPLTPEQCRYAANDVLYLMQVYPKLRDAIANQGRQSWVYQETALTGDKRTLELPSDFAYLTIKNNWQFKGAALSALQMLAKWRLDRARRHNKAVNFVMREENLVAIAKAQPTSPADLSNVQGVSDYEVRRFGDELLRVIAAAHRQPDDKQPQPVKRLVDVSGYKKTVQALRHHCQSVVEKEQIPVELIGSKKQLNQLLKWLWFDVEECKITARRPDLLRGWRSDLLRSGFESILGRSLE